MYEKFAFLIALDREKHFGRAAQLCGVSQPNLSAAIKALEQQLGLVLVDRGARFIGFTPEGERVLEWARRIVGDLRALEADVETMKHGQTGHLRIAAIPTALPVLARLTEAYWQHHPGVHISIDSRTSAEILAQLENLDADLGITYLDNEPLGRNVEIPLYRERYCLVTSRAQPLANRPTVTWEEAAGLDLCLAAPDTQNRRIFDRIFAELGVSVDPLLESNSAVVLVTHLRGGRMSTIMPKVMTEALGLAHDFAIVPIVAPEAHSLIGLVHPQRDKLPPLTAAFIAEARAVAVTLSQLT